MHGLGFGDVGREDGNMGAGTRGCRDEDLGMRTTFFLLYNTANV